MSRFHGRYDGDRRSRSPRDRSPYGDRGDRGPQYSDGDRRRPPIDNRGNSTGFPPGRDGFRDSLSGIQPPRGPKALLDAPSGPRGGGFAGGEYRGGRGGRGGGARGGRPWRDDSRDGGRERDDYRDRSWDDRSRERDRDQRDLIRDHPRDRDWQRDLPRDRPDFGPRGRRSPPPPLRPRSPGRDFGRDPRDAPLGIDAERGRRGSRDGPLSAGSSNSDPPFGGPPFRGGGFRGGRGAMGRGRGDWDQQHQRGIGRGRGFYDDRGPDRDRFHQNQRSRSQEGGPRWGGRDQDDHNRREPPRYPEPNRDVRDERDIPRDNRDRELLRPAKLDRPSEPPSAKDVSPPPVAPSAPPFGSVLSRDIQSLTGRPPPTGPRALADERPGSAGQAVSNDRAPPTGPSKPLLTDSSPSIPSGPRAQRDQKRPTPSSIQWVNPAVKHSKDGPKSARSYSFQSQGQRPLGPFRSDFSHPEFYEHGKRARSPDAKSDSHTHSSNQYGAVYHGTGPNEIAIEGKRGSHSARASLDRDTRAPPDRQTRAATEDGDVVMGGTHSNISPVDRVPKETQPLADHAQSQRLEDAGMSKASATIEAPASADTQPNPPDASLQPSLPSSESEHPARLKDIEGDDQMLDHEPEKEKHIVDEHRDQINGGDRKETPEYEPYYNGEGPRTPVEDGEYVENGDDVEFDHEMTDYEAASDELKAYRNHEPDPDSGKPAPLGLPAVEHGPIRRPTPVVVPEDDSSSDEEDYDAYFKERIATLGDEVKGIEDAVSDTPREVVARYAKSVHGALASVLVDGVTVTDLVNGVIRESAQTEEKPSAPEPVVEGKPTVQTELSSAEPKPSANGEAKEDQTLHDVLPKSQAQPQSAHEAQPEAPPAILDDVQPKPQDEAPEVASVQEPLEPVQVESKSETSKPEETSEPEEPSKPKEPSKPEETVKDIPQPELQPEAGAELDNEETGKAVATNLPQEPPREPTREPTQEPKTREPTRELSALPTVENGEDVEAQSHSAELQPKVEDMDVEGSALPSVPPVEEAMQVDEDVDMQDADMQDASEVHETVEPPHRSVSVSGRRSASVSRHSAPGNARSVSVINEGPAEEVMRGIFAPNPFLQSRDSRSIPSQMDDEESEDRTEDDQSIQSIYGSVEVVRQYSPTPPTEDLPPLNVRPWHENGRAFELRENSPGFGDFLLSHMDEEWTTTKAKQDELRREYRQGYDAYLRFTASDDPVAIKSRTHFASDGTTEKSGRSSHSDSRPEGNRRTTGRFATELDLKNALEQSRREHQERQEREARAQREKYRTEKEAVIPNMFWTETEKEQASFYDTAGLLPLEKLVATWNVVPWHVNFTDEEAERFERVYLEHPKQWGRIAQEMPNRDTGTIIQYYYSKKRELNLKEKLRRQPKKRKRGGRKQRSSALVSELGNGENETEDTAQETGENGERRRPPRRAAAPNFGGNEATPNADSDGATPAATPGRRRAATTAEAKNDSGAEKPEVKKVGRRKTKGEKDAVKAGKPPAQTPIPSPLAVPGKTGRSRANSKVQGPPEWVSPQTPVDLAARMPVQFEITPGSMQPPLVPHHQPQPHHTSPDRPVAPLQSTMADVMAPPPSSLTLRPDPPQPPASGPTFEIPQPAGADRNRTPQQQASSYWSVAESNDFPHLLRAFGTDWVSIAAHMQTKTPTMVKNFYMRNTKDGGKTEWEGVATEADQKARRGEKRPDPPPLSVGPRKKYDVPSGHRPLAAAEPEEATLTKIEPGPPPSSFSRFQVPIAQAAPVSHPLAQPTQTVMPTPLAPSSAPAQHQPPPGGPSVTQAMSPHNNPLRPPALPGYQYQEREPEPTPSQPPMPSSQQQQQQPQPQQQHVRISQKPPATTSAPHTPVVEVAPRPPGFDHIPHPFALVPQQKDSRELRDARERQRMEHSQREPPRPVRMKQEPSDQPAHHPEAYPPYQPPPRSEPLPLARQPEPIRVAPSSQPYAPPPVPAHQAMRSLLSDSVPQGTTPIMSANDRPPSTMQRPPPVSMQEPYGGMSLSAPSAPPPPPQPPTPARPPEPRKTSSIMSLLNDDPPPPPAPTRVAEVAASVKTSSTPPPPPPQSMGVRQPAQSTTSQSSHRDIEAGYPYSRGAPQAPPAAIPPLKPYHTQSPQSGHVRVPSSSMVSNRDAAMEAQAARDYYPRHAYPSSHQTSAASSPQTHPVHHYPQQPPQQQHAPQPHPSQRAQQHPPQHPPQHPSQHPSQHPQSQHGQQRSISYQQQQQQYPYPVSQSHAASPTPQYATHPSMQPRREPIAQPSSRDSWPPAQQQGAPQQQIHHPQQQQVQQQQQQQQLHQQHHSQQQQQQQQHAQQQQQQSSWPPSHQAPPPKTQPQVQSAWGAQHGVQAKTPVSSSVSSQQHAWPASGPSQPSQPFNLRDRAPPVYPQDTQSPTAGMVHHQHHRSLGGGQFPPASQDSRRGEPAPPPQSQPYPPRYASTPGPGQVRDPGVRSYTPANAYDSRPPPPPSYAQQQQDAIRDAQLRDMHMRDAQMREMREMQAREMRGDPRDPREMGRDPRELARGPDPRDLREMGREPGPPRDPREAAAAAAAAAAHQQAQQQAMLGRQLRPQDPYDRGVPDQRRY